MEPLIHTLDLVEFVVNPASAIAKLKEALSTTGFFFLQNHGMSLSIIERGEKSFKEFLTVLPLNKRMIYAYPDKHYQIGYTPQKIETGEFAKVADEKHFFHVFPKDMPVITDVPFFGINTIALWKQFNSLAEQLMRYIAISIGEYHDFFKSTDGKHGYSILRGIHYPAGQKPVDDDEAVTEGGNAAGMCASKHTDINMITLLLAKEPGLQLWHEGKWAPVTITDPNLIIVNCGDMLQHLTNGFYKSGLHRVVCQEDKERFSIPFFYHVPDDFKIFPLIQFGDQKEEFKFKTAGKFLKHRLKKIGLMK